MKKGKGEHQKNMELRAELKLLNILKDLKWHQYSELASKTRLSSATLSKHLKRHVLLEKRVDTTSGKYPYPVYYKVKDRAGLIVKIVARAAVATSDFWLGLKETKDQNEYLEILGDFFQNGLLSFLKYKKEQNILTDRDMAYMVHLFMDPIELAAVNFINRFSKTEE